MTIPNLIIGGAPKCGTSSVFRWLTDHPETLASSPKETFYLIDTDNPLLNNNRNIHSHGLDGYSHFFDGEASSSTRVFEATTHYLYSRTARDVLARLKPKPDVIFILRQPSDRVYSSFRYTKNNLAQIADHITFSEYLDVIQGRSEQAVDEVFHSHKNAYVAERELDYSRYADYIASWIEALGEDRVHVLLFENLVRDQQAFMIRLAEIIGIDPEFYRDYEYEQKNATIQVRNKTLHRWARRLGHPLPSGPVKRAAKKLYLTLQANTDSDGSQREDQTALRQLDAEFTKANQRLATLCNVDVSLWKRNN